MFVLDFFLKTSSALGFKHRQCSSKTSSALGFKHRQCSSKTSLALGFKDVQIHSEQMKFSREALRSRMPPIPTEEERLRAEEERLRAEIISETQDWFTAVNHAVHAREYFVEIDVTDVKRCQLDLFIKMLAYLTEQCDGCKITEGTRIKYLSEIFRDDDYMITQDIIRVDWS